GGERHGSRRRCRSYQASSAAGSGRCGEDGCSTRIDGMKRPRADQTTERLAAASQQGERRPGLRAAGLAASRVVAPVVAGRGGGILARLKAEWAAVVGSELAALTWPEAHSRDGALKLRVDSRFALDLQHRAPLVIDRITMFFGRASLTRLVFVQGGLPLAAPACPA